MKASVVLLLDKRRKKANEKYPVKLRVTYNREQKYYPLDVDLGVEDFEKCFERNARGEFLKWKIQFATEEAKANEIIKKLPVFSFDTFTRKFYQNQLSTESVYDLFENVIKEKINNEDLGTASNYECSLNSLKGFRSKLGFNDVTREFLLQYQNHLLKQGKSISSVGIYLRPLRAIMNIAIAEGLISKEDVYPFGIKKYQIPASRNKKKALNIDEVEKIFRYQAIEGSWEQKAKDYWLFSYLANGMNMKDIALLTHKNLDGDYIRFLRAKTRNTNRIQSEIATYVTPEMKDIMKRQINRDEDGNIYLFPILSPEASPLKKRRAIQQFTKMVNKYMKRIALKLEIAHPVTTSYARHTFSTVMKRSGANVEYISEALGHSSTLTTRNYLDSFEDETKKEMSKTLTDFKSPKT